MVIVPRTGHFHTLVTAFFNSTAHIPLQWLSCINPFFTSLTRWALSSWSTCASWSSPPSSRRRSRGRTPWWGNSVLVTCPTTPLSPATANQARATRRCYATSATFIASSHAGCRGYTPGGTGWIWHFSFWWHCYFFYLWEYPVTCQWQEVKLKGCIIALENLCFFNFLKNLLEFKYKATLLDIERL